MATLGFFGRDEEWKRLRSFLQKDLLAPVSAREYLPSILEGAKKSSPKAAEFCEEGKLVRFLNFSAMDMFLGVLFGRQDCLPDEDYNNFCHTGVDALGEIFKIIRDPYENINYMMGITSSRMKRLHGNVDIVNEIAQRNLRAFLERIEKGDITENERHSYFAKAVKRQKESDVSVQEVSQKDLRDVRRDLSVSQHPLQLLELSMMMMFAATDTTASKTSWNVLQLALNPKVQDELYGQIDRAVQKEGGLTPAIIEGKEIPLLRPFVRETHRCTPAAIFDLSKDLATPLEVHGREFPAGTVFGFENTTNVMSEEFVDEPLTFRPDRWLPEEVEARKGTPSAIIDHPFYSGPFSQGARKCPGSRVAYLEVQAMIAQLLLDWKIEGPEHVHWSEVPTRLETLLVPGTCTTMHSVLEVTCNVFSSNTHTAPPSEFPKEVRFVPR
jgi:cytochrome P450